LRVSPDADTWNFFYLSGVLHVISHTSHSVAFRDYAEVLLNIELMHIRDAYFCIIFSNSVFRYCFESALLFL